MRPALPFLGRGDLSRLRRGARARDAAAARALCRGPADGASGEFWRIWVAIFPLIALLRNGWRLYGPAPELDRVERELEAKERLREHHRRRAYRHGGRY